ncbi:hypothetical protein E1264_03925 [Actinomadura sp. KC216]|uniref:DUF11 domain-containing protein n=1 Tax=Actinomadura sp. KC216 TaxID=2530370 RepID=UPI001050A47F|nr:DUF11 domain-containing protein [Actinomadura sp. KC216]TDB90767.1 hypothetical protein E1264_03925 [Actinomadura sp. KC216]
MKRTAALLAGLIAIPTLLPAAHAQAEVETTADLKVSVTGPEYVIPGGNATYRMTIRNEGPDTVQSAAMSAVWTRNFRLPSSGLTGVSGFCGWTLGKPEVICGVAGGPIAPGGTRTVSFAGTVDSAASGQVEMEARVLFSAVDPVPEDNVGRATSLVTSGP